MNIRSDSAVSLVELLLAIVLMSFILLVAHNLHIFSSGELTDSMKWSRVKKDASYVLEHMAKNIILAIGNVNDPVNPPVRFPDDKTLVIFIDFNKDGKISPGDREIAYEFDTDSKEIWFYPDYSGTDRERLSQRVHDFDFSRNENFIDVEITTCWRPGDNCGDPDNPKVEIKTRIIMPSVSFN